MSTTSLSRSAALFRAVLLCSALSACGGGGGDTPAPIDPPAPPPVAAPPTPAPAPALAPFAYLVQADKVEVCEIDSGNLLTNCIDAGVPSEYQEMAAIAVAGSSAYISNLSAVGTIIHCSIGASGRFSGCAETGPSGLGSPYGLAVHGSTLYIGDSGSPRIQKCGIQPNGLLDACTDARFPDALSSAIEDLRIVGTTAYVLSYNENRVTRCDVLADGSFSNCADANVPGLASPEGVSISGNYLYVANNSAGNVVRCLIDETNGSLTDCIDAGASGLGNPTQVAIRGSSVYISDSAAAGGVTRCTVASDGLLTDCVSTPGSTLYSIAIRQ